MTYKLGARIYTLCTLLWSQDIRCLAFCSVREDRVDLGWICRVELSQDVRCGTGDLLRSRLLWCQHTLLNGVNQVLSCRVSWQELAWKRSKRSVTWLSLLRSDQTLAGLLWRQAVNWLERELRSGASFDLQWGLRWWLYHLWVGQQICVVYNVQRIGWRWPATFLRWTGTLPRKCTERTTRESAYSERSLRLFRGGRRQYVVYRGGAVAPSSSDSCLCTEPFGDLLRTFDQCCCRNACGEPAQSCAG